MRREILDGIVKKRGAGGVHGGVPTATNSEKCSQGRLSEFNQVEALLVETLTEEVNAETDAKHIKRERLGDSVILRVG